MNEINDLLKKAENLLDNIDTSQRDEGYLEIQRAYAYLSLARAKFDIL